MSRSSLFMSSRTPLAPMVRKNPRPLMQSAQHAAVSQITHCAPYPVIKPAANMYSLSQYRWPARFLVDSPVTALNLGEGFSTLIEWGNVGCRESTLGCKVRRTGVKAFICE